MILSCLEVMDIRRVYVLERKRADWEGLEGYISVVDRAQVAFLCLRSDIGGTCCLLGTDLDRMEIVTENVT